MGRQIQYKCRMLNIMQSSHTCYIKQYIQTADKVTINFTYTGK